MIKDYVGDVPVMFLQGCLGNVHCIDFDNQKWFKNSTDIINKVGRVLGAEAIKQMLTNQVCALDEMSLHFDSIRVPLPYRQVPPEEMKKALEFAENARQGNMKIGNPEEAAAIYRNNLLNRRLKNSDHNNVILNVLRLGEVVFATNPAELFVEFQLEMREKIDSKILVPCSCTNGHAFYVPTRKAHVFGGYETFVCQLEVDAGEKITAATIELANRMK